MKHCILDSYVLPNKRFNVLERKIMNQELFIYIKPRKQHTFCPECNKKTKYHYDTNSRFSKIRYESWYGHTIWMCLKKRRYLCKNNNCSKKVFTEIIPELFNRYERSSELFQKQCLHRLKNNNFKTVRQEMNISYKYIVGQLNKWINIHSLSIDWKKEFKDEEYITIGIDEHSQKKRKLVLTVTNITKGSLITILPEYSQKTLEKFLRSIPSKYRKKILFVSTDLTNRYGKTIKFWLPNARISADCFHVVGLANNMLWKEKKVIEDMDEKRKIKYFKILLKAQERLSKKEKEKIQYIFQNKKYFKLAKAYEFKEKLRTILKNENNEQAKQDFLNLINQDVWNHYSTPRKELLKYSRYYRTCIETLRQWKNEIITYIETRITNAYTEGIHNKIKLMKRMSFGLPNIKNYIKRMILTFSPLFHYV